MKIIKKNLEITVRKEWCYPAGGLLVTRKTVLFASWSTLLGRIGL
jgi:hypothetical protein